MDFADSVYELAKKAASVREKILTEEATKHALVMPFISILGYNPFDPTEVVPEFAADIGEKKGEKVDYAILKDGTPIMLFECKQRGSELSAKSATQLQRYFHGVPDVKFGVLCDGIRYLFFSDLDRSNVMDGQPFFVADLMNLDDAAIEELKRFTKPKFDADDILSTAGVLKYTREIQAVLKSEFAAPTKDFVRLLTCRVYDGFFTKRAEERFTPIVKNAFQRFVNATINETLETAKTLQAGGPRAEARNGSQEITETEEQDTGDIVTTAEEIQAYYAVKAALIGSVDLDRVQIQDARSYAKIVLDGNTRRPICRLWFNNPRRKYISLFDKDTGEERVRIEKVDEILAYRERLKATVAKYGTASRSAG